MQTPKVLGLMTALVAAMLVTLLVPATAGASNDYYYSSTPCPQWSLQDVLDDPDGDWDHDRVTNSDELYVAGGLNPCIYDSTDFCGVQPASCYSYVSTDYYDYYDYYYGYYDHYYYVYVPPVRTCSGGYWSWNAVSANPYGDWDGDGVNNYTEAYHGADPCTAPCPTAYTIDVALNPWGDWDHDGRSNKAEVHAGTNPCVANSYYYVYVPYTSQQTQRLPHVGSPTAPKVTYTAPAPPVNPCPAGYPYYHPQNGKCYANPVNTPAGW